eukprot:CAMPEP_0116836838 /NCGR_PEP_ID=MMETSP0418-20121206/8321_1 /TAXON_ID=1158023 /ORGANISM="Astrosyne radiata, Strain 13vi08-1A" /LENGTH=189 /DNA_ID=CAMNT_0004466657 /DNA_START=57 /DNA_END=626 /DNA_ORIENTATION=+
MPSRPSTDVTEETEGGSSVLSKLFSSCESDPKGSVHRAWGIVLLLLVVFFVVSIFETLNLKHVDGSGALILASVWAGVVHLILALLGTFVLKRFPTSFAIGFFLGFLVVTANQNLILFCVFHSFKYGNLKTNHAFANLALALFLVLSFFIALLVNFHKDLLVAAVDAKGLGRKRQTNDDCVSYTYEDHQ